MYLEVAGVSKALGGRQILRDVSFRVEKGELASIIGPSGVGKTTLLRLIAGLDSPDKGELRFKVPPGKNNPVILVFQDYLLFPSMTVFENTAFGLRARKVENHEISERVMSILGYFGLEDKAFSYPNELSAGQKQRVAIARAMVVNPSILLLDEPFANLDRNLKLSTAEFIRETQQRFNVTTISVTHDLEEAFVMSDHIGVMMQGHLVQYADAQDIYHSPTNHEAAKFLGPVNVLDTELCNVLGYAAANGQSVYVRPEAISLAIDSEGVGVVKQRHFLGHFRKYIVGIRNAELIVYSLHEDFEPGTPVRLEVHDHLKQKGRAS